MRRRTAALLAAAVLALSAAAAAKIIGADDRKAEPDFDAVGKLICVDPAAGKRVQSTMTLVGDRRTIIGVGHFGAGMVAGLPGAMPLSSCQFELYGKFRGRIFGSAIEKIVAARYTPNPRPDIRTADWTVLRLAEPAPDLVQPVRLQPLGMTALAKAKDAFLVAYHRDQLPGARMRSTGCAPAAIAGHADVFRHGCDTDLESSGGLLFRNGPYGPHGVAVNFAQSSDGHNYGKLLDPEMLRHLPRGAVGSPAE